MMNMSADEQIANTTILKDVVYANNLSGVLNQFRTSIKVLSLDCFDTLLWRRVSGPTDLFYDLQHYSAYRAFKITAAHRMTAEVLSRQIKFVNKGSYEVKLKEIYQLGLPHLNNEQVNALVEDEISAEIDTCYAFPPVVNLIRQAHALGIKVIIISNTYLEEKQLRLLLTNTLPADVIKMIDNIFCSCEYGYSKNNGLCKFAIQKLKINPSHILHIGDNVVADFHGAREAGMQALHLIQHDNSINELIRMQNIAAGVALSSIRKERSQVNPFRGVLASANVSSDKAESLIGYASLGPIMYGFARLICDDIAKMQSEGKNPKVLFLMRDGFLPYRACEALLGYSPGKQARISRFTATASGFRKREDVEKFLAEYISILPLNYICRQLLLPEDTAEHLLKISNAEKFPSFTLCQLVLQDKILKTIFEQSRIFRLRLICYLQKFMDIQKGDSIIFVDIGYAGTAQQMLEPVLKDEMGIDSIHGRYLMTLNLPNWESDRKGLIDPSWSEDRVMTMLSQDVSLIEEFCCSGDDSVVDYDNEGNAIFSKCVINQEQFTKIRKIQEECVRFIHDAKLFFEKCNITIPLDKLRDQAVIELSRLLYFPTENEIKYLQEFNHDKNKGYQEIYQIYNDPEKELNKLRSRGFLFKYEHPHVLRHTHLALSLALMTQRRYGFEVNLDDLSFRQEWITVIRMQGQTPVQNTCNAPITYDGYFSFRIPVDVNCSQIAIIFGKNYEFLQIESIELIKLRVFLSASEAQHSIDLMPQAIFNQIIDKGDKLFECTSANSALLINLPPREEDKMFRVVFRPIKMRRMN